MPDLIGTTLGHYRIVEQIGAGGMGVVCRAHDELVRRMMTHGSSMNRPAREAISSRIHTTPQQPTLLPRR